MIHSDSLKRIFNRSTRTHLPWWDSQDNRSNFPAMHMTASDRVHLAPRIYPETPKAWAFLPGPDGHMSPAEMIYCLHRRQLAGFTIDYNVAMKVAESLAEERQKKFESIRNGPRNSQSFVGGKLVSTRKDFSDQTIPTQIFIEQDKELPPSVLTCYITNNS